jgi:hypothetical protein
MYSTQRVRSQAEEVNMEDGVTLAELETRPTMTCRVSRGSKELVSHSKSSSFSPKILPENLATNFASVWPEVQDNLTVIVKILRQELIFAEPSVNLVEALQNAGLTGPMLLMKQNSLFRERLAEQREAE